MIKIISWNVNSIKMRLELTLDLLKKYNPDIVLLQELKCESDRFPLLEIQSLGYNAAVYGQKSYNGVAILSKSPIEDIKYGISEFDDPQSRYIECFTFIKGRGLRVASVYVPNGQEVGSDKFLYKLNFYKSLKLHLQNLLQFEEVTLIGGDFNVAPEEIDVYDPQISNGKICFTIEERNCFRELCNLGYYDSFLFKNPKLHEFSWWDYRGNKLKTDNGLRIDQILTSPEATDLIQSAGIYKEIRHFAKASDHAPIFVDLKE